MKQSVTNLSPKVAQKFNCEYCDYFTCKLYDYKKHLSTDKHKKRENVTNVTENKEKVAKKFNCICGAIYNNRMTLWRHTNKGDCIKKNVNDDEESENLSNITTDKDLIMLLIKENQDLKKYMMEQQTMFFENNNKVLDICKNGIVTNNINNTHTNSHNKTFNLQFFLNETCKDAMNIMDFVDSIKLQLNDLEKVGELGYVEGISNIIVQNLKALDIDKRPVHCTDSKREVLYIKDENKWEKENEEKNKMKKAIKRVANKNISLLPEFKSKYPDCIYSESKKSDQYNKIIIEAFQLENQEKQEKIIKKIAKEVTIDKNN